MDDEIFYNDDIYKTLWISKKNKEELKKYNSEIYDYLYNIIDKKYKNYHVWMLDTKTVNYINETYDNNFYNHMFELNKLNI